MDRIADRLWRQPLPQSRWLGWVYLALGFFMVGPRSTFWRPSDSLDVPGFIIGLAWLALGGSVLVQEHARSVARALRIAWISVFLLACMGYVVAFATSG